MRKPPKPIITLAGASFHSEEATAQLLGISRATLSGWRKNKEGPGHCAIAQSTYYPETTLREWLETQARNCHRAPEQQPGTHLVASGDTTAHDHDWKLMSPPGKTAFFKCVTCIINLFSRDRRGRM